MARSAQPEQAGVGVGGARQPVQQDRQHLRHQLRGSREAPGQLPYGLRGAFGVGEAERLQALDDRFRRQEVGPGPGRGGGREGLQQRTEEQALVNPANPAAMMAQVRFELAQGGGRRLVAVPEDTGQTDPGVRLGRQGVDLLILVELQPVLDGPQEPVGGLQGRRILGSDVAAGGQGGERGQGRGRPQAGIRSPVDLLEQLNGELDVADAARSQFQLPVGQAPPGHGLLGPGFEPADLAQFVRTERPAPDPRRRPPPRTGRRASGCPPPPGP